MRGKSRLWRKLGAKELLFRTHTGAQGSIGDAAITGITITRGADSAEPNIPIATCQYTIRGEFHNIVGSRSLVEMTDYGAQLVASLAGNIHPDAVKTRFWGRTGIVSIADHRPELKYTTIQSASWLSAAKLANHTPGIAVGKQVGQITGEAIDIPNLRAVYKTRAYGTYDTVFSIPEDAETRGFSDVTERYGLSTGLQIVERFQSREVQVWSIPARIEAVKKTAETAPHLTRSAAISPARHSQNIDQWNYQHSVRTTTAEGRPETLGFPAQTDRTYLEKKDIDLSYIRRTTEQVFLFAAALQARTTFVRTTPESITVDILALLTSESLHHRHQAGYLLALQPKDPVFFSGDWQEYLQGTYTAEQIRETITPDAWTLELSLFPAQWTLGKDLDDIAPDPQTWDAATALTWDRAQGIWNEYGNR